MIKNQTETIVNLQNENNFLRSKVSELEILSRSNILNRNVNPEEESKVDKSSYMKNDLNGEGMLKDLY